MDKFSSEQTIGDAIRAKSRAQATIEVALEAFQEATGLTVIDVKIETTPNGKGGFVYGATLVVRL